VTTSQLSWLLLHDHIYILLLQLFAAAVTQPAVADGSVITGGTARF
jgi:hypothetical protein